MKLKNSPDMHPSMQYTVGVPISEWMIIQLISPPLNQ